MNSRLGIVFSLLCLFSSCTQAKKVDSSHVGYSTIFSFSEDIKEQFGWNISSFGGAFDEKILNLSVDYDICEMTSIDQARKMMIDVSQKFLKFINQKEEIKNFLVNYPFTCNLLKIGLSFVDQNGGFLLDNQLAYVKLVNGKISYKVSGEKMLETIHQETFEEALKIVESEKQQKSLLTSEPL